MALLSVIRRWNFREDITVREIERRTGLSRNTIRKYLRGAPFHPQTRRGRSSANLGRNLRQMFRGRAQL